MNTSLSLSPVSATAAGYHNHNGQNLDQMLDDVSLAGFDRQRRFYTEFRTRLNKAVNPNKLSPEDRADYDMIQDQISLGLLELNQIQSYLHNPTMYVELVGNALFTPYVLEYAPKSERFQDIIARLRQLPKFLDDAKVNLISAPDIWTTVAAQENQGNIDLVQKTLAAAVPPEMRKDYEEASGPALAALGGFQDFLKNHLSKRDDFDWRLGQEKYAQKFHYYLETDVDPATVLQDAEQQLQAVRGQMLKLALPLHQQMFPGHREHAELAPTDRDNRIISEVLDRIAQKHSTPESYIADAKQDLEEARQFVAAKHLLDLPSGDNLQVIPTPEFMRGLYSVGGFDPAPPLQPQLGAFYWVTPIPKDWPRQRIESKLQEYNFYKLKLLTIHEAVPGHYVQAEFANAVQPKTRRIVRSLYGNNAYIEGWAQYATQMMLDAGFLDNSPELRLTFLKEELRVLANAVLDIRLQTLNMSDQEALSLMEKQTFQEQEEATEKLQRAKLSSCQLPTYFVGWADWLRVREQYKKAHSNFTLSEFNDRALQQGAVPLPVLAQLLTGQRLAAAQSIEF